MRGNLLTAPVLLASSVVMWSSEVFAAPNIEAGACITPPCAFAPLAGASGFPTISFGPDGVAGVWEVTGGANAATTAMGASFLSDTITTSTTSGGTIDIIFSVTGAQGEGVGTVFGSSFTSNEQVATTHSVTENTFFDPANGLFNNSPATLLSTALLTLSGPDVVGPLDVTRDSTLGTFSAAEEYVISLTGGCSVATPCSANLTIDLTATPASVPAPEPASLALLGTALAGFAWLGHRRRRQAWG